MSTSPVPVQTKPSFTMVMLAILPAVTTVSMSIQTLVDPNTNMAGKKSAVENMIATGIGVYANIKGVQGGFDPAHFKDELDAVTKDAIAVWNELARVMGKKPISL